MSGEREHSEPCDERLEARGVDGVGMDGIAGGSETEQTFESQMADYILID